MLNGRWLMRHCKFFYREQGLSPNAVSYGTIR
jgi:hypothetical protein